MRKIGQLEALAEKQQHVIDDLLKRVAKLEGLEDSVGSHNGSGPG